MRALAVGLALALALPAFADEVVLRNGSRFEGKVKENGDQVVVVMDFGEIAFNRSDVVKIIPGKSSIQEFDSKVTELKSDEIEGRLKLAMWAKNRDLNNRAKALLEEILVINPDHAGARAELGYTKVEGRWLTADEAKAAQGLVKFRGAWVKQSEAEAVLQREADRSVEAARDMELVTAQRRLLEAEADYVKAKAEGERVRTEIERVKQESARRWVPIMVWYVNDARIPAAHHGCASKTPVLKK